MKLNAWPFGEDYPALNGVMCGAVVGSFFMALVLFRQRESKRAFDQSYGLIEVPQWNSNFHRLNFGGKASDYTALYYTNKQILVVDSRYGPTNIIISNDYSGTIQIGTNFWRVDDLLLRHREWSLVFSNGHDGPFGVYRYGGDGITGLFLIDYSTNRIYTAP